MRLKKASVHPFFKKLSLDPVVLANYLLDSNLSFLDKVVERPAVNISRLSWKKHSSLTHSSLATLAMGLRPCWSLLQMTYRDIWIEAEQCCFDPDLAEAFDMVDWLWSDGPPPCRCTKRLPCDDFLLSPWLGYREWHLVRGLTVIHTWMWSTTVGILSPMFFNNYMRPLA